MKLSIRISSLHWMNPERNQEFFELLRAHPEVTEVAFFTQITHVPLPLAEHQKRAEVLREVLPLYREAGVRAGINNLCTIGHLDENLDHSLREPWQRLVDSAGQVAAGGFCLSDPRLREYVKEIYQLLARTQPDFIWIDDDLRLEGHVPVGCACFCPLCLKAWSEKTGTEWTRESLVASFSEGSREEKIARRRAWLEHNRAYLTDGLRLIRQAVNEVNPDLSLGFMTSPLTYSGAGFAECARELTGERDLTDLPAMWRPGGGFYNEDYLPACLSKLHLIGAQVEPMPAELTDIQYELENFPYHRLKKSSTMVAAEIAGAIGVGCTGAALNTTGMVSAPIWEFKVHFDKIQQCMPFYKKAVATFGRSRCEGVGITLSPDARAAMIPDGEWLSISSWDNQLMPSEWSEIGLPFCYGAEGRRVTLLAGDSVLIWSQDELRKILAGGVVLDGTALNHLNAMGLGDLTGFASHGTKERDTLERFTSDELNTTFAGWSSDCRPSFGAVPSFLLEPTQPGSRVLSELIDYLPQSFGPVSGVFENEFGGRVAVFGYYAWWGIQSFAKTEQLKKVVRWLSRDTVPGYVESFTKTAIWCRRDSQNRPAFMVLNVSLDESEIVVRVIDAPSELRCVHMDGREETIPQRGEGSFTIPNLGAWKAALLIDGRE